MMMLPLLASLIMLHLIPAKYFLLKTEDKTEERQVNAVISSGGGGDDGNTVSPNTDGRAPARWSTSSAPAWQRIIMAEHQLDQCVMFAKDFLDFTWRKGHAHILYLQFLCISLYFALTRIMQ